MDMTRSGSQSLLARLTDREANIHRIFSESPTITSPGMMTGVPTL